MGIQLCFIWSAFLAATVRADSFDLALPMPVIIPAGQKRAVSSTGARSAFEMETVAYPMTKHNEPSCEQLRAMWRASRRQSRAAEMTNEIPKLKDPFVYPQHSYTRYYPYAGEQRIMSPKVSYRFGIRRPFPFFPQRNPDLSYSALLGPEPIDSGNPQQDMLDLSSKISGSGRFQPQSTAGSFNILRDLVSQEKLQEQVAIQRKLGITPSPLEEEWLKNPNRNSGGNAGGGVYGRIFYSPEAAARYRNEVRTFGATMEDEPKQIDENNENAKASNRPPSRSYESSQPQADPDVTSRGVQQGAREHFRRPRLFQPAMTQCHLTKGKPCSKDDDCSCSHKFACFSGTCIRKNIIRSVQRSWNQGEDSNSSDTEA